MQKVIILVDQVGRIDCEIERVEKLETERIRIKDLKQLVGHTNGDMIDPENPN